MVVCVCVCEKLLQYKTCVNTLLLLCLLVCVHELMVELVGKGRRIIVWCVVCVQEFLKSVAEMEGQLDGMEGLGLLLAGGCVTADKEVILKRTSELRLELSHTLNKHPRTHMHTHKH